jgi:GTP1/Obg family GTP-binding protein
MRDGLEIKARLNALLEDRSLPNPLQPAGKYIPSIAEFVRSMNLPKWPLLLRFERLKVVESFRTINSEVAQRYFEPGTEHLFDASDLEPHADETETYPGVSDDLFAQYVDYLRRHHRQLFFEIVAQLHRMAENRMVSLSAEPHRVQASLNAIKRKLRKLFPKIPQMVP